MGALASLAPLGPALRRLGKIGTATADAAEKALAIQKDHEELAALPDQFNMHFASRGWCAHEGLSVGVMREAVQLADSGDIDSAESVLVKHHSAGEVEQRLVRMTAHPPSGPERNSRRRRSEIIEKGGTTRQSWFF